MFTIQEPLADRTILQMDKAASSYKAFLRSFRKRREISNLDRRLSLRPYRHHQEEAQSRCFALHTLLQILSVTIFEKMPLLQAFQDDGIASKTMEIRNQLNLYDS